MSPIPFTDLNKERMPEIDHHHRPSEVSVASLKEPMYSMASKISSVEDLVKELDFLFMTIPKEKMDERRKQIFDLFERVQFDTTNTEKFIHFDHSCAYTRNLVETDDKNYTLLLLCWTPGIESKIHDHPCDGCFVKALQGTVKENTYSVEASTDRIVPKSEKLYEQDQVSYMHNDLGLHKIGNPHPTKGAITLHLYTPPFNTCKVWSDEAKFSQHGKGVIGYYSMYGKKV